MICVFLRSFTDLSRSTPLKWTQGSDSLSWYPVGTVCAGIRPTRRHVGTGPGLFLGVSDEDRSYGGPVDSLVHGDLSHCRDTRVGVTRSGVLSTG